MKKTALFSEYIANRYKNKCYLSSDICSSFFMKSKGCPTLDDIFPYSLSKSIVFNSFNGKTQRRTVKFKVFNSAITI